MDETIRIMCVSSTDALRSRLRRLLDGVVVDWESGLGRALEQFEVRSFDVLVVTGAAVKRVKGEGLELLEVVFAKSPGTRVLFLAESGEIRMAMSALKAGTYQYARLPIGDEELRLLVETALARAPRFGENLLLRQDGSAGFAPIIGRSPPMQELYRQIRQAAATDIPVLLTGETGTGKDLAAQAIHQQSGRKDGPYVPVHLGALPQELVASELFGHEKGAFTGAVRERPGKFEEACGGTVFLDEISTVDEKVQVSLLRLIEQRQLTRIGGQEAVRTDVRLITASNEDLLQLARRGTFREDLYYRLDVFHISLPPLRSRSGDIPLLIDVFMKRYNDEFQKQILGISPECVASLENYPWPGNVRELKNVIQRAVLVCPGEVLLPAHLPSRISAAEEATMPQVTFTVGTPLAEIEREMVMRTLKAVGHNKKRAAEVLGISRRALYGRLERYERG